MGETVASEQQGLTGRTGKMAASWRAAQMAKTAVLVETVGMGATLEHLKHMGAQVATPRGWVATGLMEGMPSRMAIMAEMGPLETSGATGATPVVGAKGTVCPEMEAPVVPVEALAHPPLQ
jgi:hypothetical protein